MYYYWTIEFEDRELRKAEVCGWCDNNCVEVSFIVCHICIRRRTIIVHALCAGIPSCWSHPMKRIQSRIVKKDR